MEQKMLHLPVEGKIMMTTFYLRVPILEYNSEPQIDVIKEFTDNSYFFQLKKCQCIPKLTYQVKLYK